MEILSYAGDASIQIVKKVASRCREWTKLVWSAPAARDAGHKEDRQ